jgi:hypothetical protein
MAEDRLFRVIVLGGMALVGAAPAVVAGCATADAPGGGTLVPQSQTVVLPETPPPADAGAPTPTFIPPQPPREGPPPPTHYPPIEAADAGTPPPVDAGTDGGFHLKPPREGPPPRPKQGF